MKKNIDIIVIMGPTSSGKSDFAVKIAKKYNGEIISADSRQIYKNMNLGTGKVEGRWENKLQIRNNKFQTNSKDKNLLNPPLRKGEDRRKIFIYKDIPHYLIDFVNLKDEYNVSHFKKDTEKLIKDINSRGKTPIICGGTGFWISSVVFNEKFPKVKPNKKLRSMLRNKTAEGLFKKLKSLDSKRASKIDKKNKQRLIRAIEIATELGKVPEIKKGDYKICNNQITDSRNKFFYPFLSLFLKGKNNNKIVLLNKGDKFWNFYQIVLDIKIEDLEKKIKERLKKRFVDGMIKEIKELKEKNNLSWKRIQSFGLAYYWIPLYLQGKISKSEVKKRVYLSERQYAKRQLTWLKKQKGLNWY